jgi:hypothetical protein
MSPLRPHSFQISDSVFVIQEDNSVLETWWFINRHGECDQGEAVTLFDNHRDAHAYVVRRAFIGPAESQQRCEIYERSRMEHALAHPIIESASSFVITPALEAERARRIAGRQWVDPEPKEEYAISVFETEMARPQCKILQKPA